ncbi:MAG: hypothetical protein JWN86_3554 [Planctomycetota bacterium]|nr:hypothetical protein [Planctomycetota bacterium]
MAPVVLLLGVFLVVPQDSAADTITLRDGKILLGQVVEPAPRGKLVVIVRRAWAEKAMPARYKTWQTVEAPAVKRSRSERMARLEAWKRERGNEPNDTILGWIDPEIARLKAEADTPPLMVVSLNRTEVKAITRRPPQVARMLRQAWRAGFIDAETKPVADLTSALDGRGFVMTGVDSAPIDDLLPLPAETEPHWKARRAATEVAQDRSLRFIRYQGLLLPEGTPGEPINATGALGGLMKSLLGEEAAEDPLVAKGREAASKGRVGLLVTRLDTAEDLSGVKVEITLYARLNGDRWERAASRTVNVRGDDVQRNAGANIAADPQVQTVFKTIEGLGLAVPEDLKQKSLNIGAATQKALGMARTAIQPDLDALELPVGNAAARAR